MRSMFDNINVSITFEEVKKYQYRKIFSQQTFLRERLSIFILTDNSWI